MQKRGGLGISLSSNTSKISFVIGPRLDTLNVLTSFDFDPPHRLCTSRRWGSKTWRA